MRLLVTRPEADGIRTAAAIREAGHEPVLAPLTDIRPIQTDPPDARHFDGLLATSRHGIAAISTWPDGQEWSKKPAFCVGAATARAARDIGLAKAVEAGGDIDALLEDTRMRAFGGTLLYPSARDISVDPAPQLKARGIGVTRLVVYAAEPLAALPEPVLAQLRSGGVDGTVFLSARAVSLLAEWLTGPERRALFAFCLSDRVARAAEKAGFEQVAVAEEPTEAALIRSIDAPR